LVTGPGVRVLRVGAFSMVLCLGLVGAAEDAKVEAKDASSKEARTKFIKEEFARWSFAIAPPGERSVSSDSIPAAGVEPVLRYTNPIGNLVQDGATCLFRREGVPVAAWSISIRGPDEPLKVWVEMTSLVAEPARCEKDGSVRWSPVRGGLIGKSLAGADVPSEKPALRLVQMRDVARKFSVELYKKEDPNPTILRLMSQPIDRYRHEKSGIVDGALFSFVEANDPEVLLGVEAVAGEGRKPGWRYSVVRMTSRRVRVLRDGQAEFEAENYWKGPRSPTDAYVEMENGVLNEE
jgi:hypothetical protein